MNATWWFGVDNATESVNASDGEFPTGTMRTPPAPHKIVFIVGFPILILGICANSTVLAVLVRARRQFGSSVNTLIINQSLMDLLACCCFIAIATRLHSAFCAQSFTGAFIRYAVGLLYWRDAAFRHRAYILWPT